MLYSLLECSNHVSQLALASGIMRIMRVPHRRRLECCTHISHLLPYASPLPQACSHISHSAQGALTSSWSLLTANVSLMRRSALRSNCGQPLDHSLSPRLVSRVAVQGRSNGAVKLWSTLEPQFVVASRIACSGARPRQPRRIMLDHWVDHLVDPPLPAVRGSIGRLRRCCVAAATGCSRKNGVDTMGSMCHT